ncbi:DUF937 domain-containing protein [Agrococcus sp. 1P02AA]|uniref:DUF937 domain-containing protein n=1 Tax=Agrococcus sp. 1P02AA TaxID=3132259 RepID=UPI0039A5FD29
MSEIQQLIGQIPIQQVAQQAGVDEAEARQAIEAIVPALVGGMQANAHDPSGAQSLMGALGAHQGHLDERLAGNIDPDDGQRIVRNVFGDNTEQIARAAGGGSALGGIIQKILPIVAPIVIAWIANRFFAQGGPAQAEAPEHSGGGFDSPFGQGSPGSQQQIPTPGQQGQARQQSEGFGLDDLLGGVLGGGSKQGGGLGGLGDLLGGLLGGGRR